MNAIIVAAGPSLDPKDIPTYHEIADVVVTVNRGFYAWRNYPNLRPDAVFVMDGCGAFRDCMEDMVECVKDIQIFCPITNVAGKTQYAERWESMGMNEVYGLPFNDDALIEKNPFAEKWETRYCKPAKSVLFAWQFLARTEGIKKIGIAGADLRVDPKQRYFFDWPEMSSNQHKLQCRSVGATFECFKHWIPFADEFGIQTVNLSGTASRLSTIIESETHGEFCRGVNV